VEFVKEYLRKFVEKNLTLKSNGILPANCANILVNLVTTILVDGKTRIKFPSLLIKIENQKMER